MVVVYRNEEDGEDTENPEFRALSIMPWVKHEDQRC